MLEAHALITVGQAKLVLGITGNDELLETLINGATYYIEGRCGRRFKETTYTQETYDGPGSNELVLKNYPVTAFTTLEKRTSYDNSNSWEAIDDEDYWVDMYSGTITGTCKFSSGPEKYRVTYSAGYASIPYDLQYACAVLVGDMMNKGKSAGIKQESLGDHSVLFEAVAIGNPVVYEIIDKYRAYALAR